MDALDKEPARTEIVGAMLVRDGRILLGKRGPNRPTFPDCWDLIGGHVEPGEGTEAAIKREVEEELGVYPTSLTLVARLDPFEAPTGPIDYHIYAVTRWHGGEPRLADREHTALAWFFPREIAELGDMSLSGNLNLFETALEKR